MQRTTIGLLTLSLAFGLGGGLAEAGGFASARFGGEHGHPTTDNPTAIYYNPAGLALGSGTRLFIEGLIVYRNASYTRPKEAIHNVGDGESGTPNEAVSANAGEATLSNFLVSPFLGVATDFGIKNLGVGLALYAPFGGQASWDQNSEYKGSEDYPGAVDGVQRWATMEGQLRVIYLSTAASYKIPGPKISLGASVSLVSQSANTLRARTAIGNDDLVNGNGNLIEGRSHIDVSGITFAMGLGAIWEPMDALRLGLSYQSQPGFGETTMKGDLNFKFGNGLADTSAIDLTQELPDIVRFGASYKPQENLELRFAADYTRWSVFTNQCLMDSSNQGRNCTLDEKGGNIPGTSAGVIVNVERNWQDTFGVRGGASYWLDKNIELVGGLTFDTNAVPDETMDPLFIDMNKLVATLGGRFALIENMLLNVSYTHVYYFTREVDVRKRDSMGEDIGFSAPSAVPDMAGRYKQMLGLLNLGVEYQF